MTTIDATALISALSGQPASSSSVPKQPVATRSSAVDSADENMDSSLQSSESNLQQAAQQIQDYLSGHTDPPQYVVDYLSGLQVMTVRSATNGQVVFQLPNSDALRLAQLLHEGSPVKTAGLVDTQA